MCQEPGSGPECRPHMKFHACGPFGHKDFQGMAQMFKHHIGQCMKHLSGWIPYNLEDQGTSYLITIPIPGRTKEEVTVNLINKTLNIKATKPKEIKEAEEKSKESKDQEEGFPWMRKFFTFIDVDMDIPLPAEANEAEIKSAMANGVLKIRIGKNPPKNINIGDNVNN